jgi:hypothetical protein
VTRYPISSRPAVWREGLVFVQVHDADGKLLDLRGGDDAIEMLQNTSFRPNRDLLTQIDAG